ncbi:MAG: CCA tRNA nucleotidyltransferase, partial [Defluviitaleaceae bacterium]|nr:CCA tRNA nucleotidyltransferase [Defluviitaleaceae bacterium]
MGVIPYTRAMRIPPEAQKILSTLESAGFEGFVVGGCVRDVLRGITPKDWDITTNATPHQVKALFPRTFDTGIRHGTISVLENRKPYEVTTYRIDGTYTDARRPDSVTYASSIEEDLSRRDFTMNAIAYSPAHGFADPFSGREDIAAKIIRCVGDPAHRFGEDALRMLRALRFAGTLGFAVDPATLTAISAQKENLARISAERVREELTRLLCGAYPHALSLLAETGLLPYVLQTGNSPYPGNLTQTIRQLEEAPPDAHLRLSLFFAPFHTGGAPALEKLLRALRFDNKTIQAISLYTRLLPHSIPADPYAIKKHLKQMPQPTAQAFFENLLALQEITGICHPAHATALRRISQEIHARNECYTLSGLAVNGKDLAAMGIPPGKAMGNALEKLLDAVMRQPELNEKGGLEKIIGGFAP